MFHTYNIIGENESVNMSLSFYQTRLFIEIAIHLLIPNPFYDKAFDLYVNSEDGKKHTPVVYLLSDFLIALMHIRVIYIIKSLVNYSIYTDAYSLRLCQSYGFQGGARFYLKCLYNQYPLAINFTIFTIAVLVLSNLLRIFEIPFYRLESTVDSFLLDNFF